MPLLSEALPMPTGFTPGEYRIEEARAAWQKSGCFKLRRTVFCDEQKIFKIDDRDDMDDVCILLAASSCMFGHVHDVVGTVRIHQPEPGLWWGSRLAVAKPCRRIGGLGPALIKFAVGTAKFYGAKAFFAHVQSQNRGLFEALAWRVVDDKTIHGVPHFLMEADVAAYAPTNGMALRLLPAIAGRA
jgi:putative N-acetyltransferase (TIGR04045 family)